MNVSWSYAAVAFIDILGFSVFVESDVNSVEPIHLVKLKELLASVKGASPKLDVRAFSDSIVISAPLISDQVAYLLQTTVDLQRKFIAGGVLVRGGVAFGKHFADETLVYSEALIKSYLLERDKARFPRILVAGDLLDWFFHDPATEPELAQAIDAIMLTDRDNFSFLNYLLPANLLEHISLIESYADGRSSPSVLEKIQWLCQYHNFVATQAKSESLYSGAMTHGFRALTISP